MGTRPNIGNNIPLGHWIKNFLNLLRKKKRDIDLPHNKTEIDTFPSTLWPIWLHQNEIVFKNTMSSPLRVMAIFEDHMRRQINTRNAKHKSTDTYHYPYQATELLETTDKINQNLAQRKGNIQGHFLCSIQVDGLWKQVKLLGKQFFACLNDRDNNHWESNKVFATSPGP